MRDPGATYQEVRDRVIRPQPEHLARYREEHRRPYTPPVPDPADEVVAGKTGEHFEVEKGVQAAPEVPGIRRTRRIWCSVCLGYWTPQEKKAGEHAHRPAVPVLQSRRRRKRRPRRQWWKTEGLAGGWSVLAPDPRARGQAAEVIRGTSPDVPKRDSPAAEGEAPHYPVPLSLSEGRNNEDGKPAGFRPGDEGAARAPGTAGQEDDVPW